MKHPLFIVQVCPYLTKHDGDYRYRIGQPGYALARQPGVSVANMNPISPCLQEVALEADILILHLLRDPDLLPLIAERKRLGRPTVYEIPDNFAALPRHISSLFQFGQALPLSLNFQLIRASDAIQAVSDVLLEKYGFLHDHRLRFENHILFPGSPPSPAGKEIVIGWGGSVGHTEDLRWIAPVILDLCRQRNDIRFSFMGDRGQFHEVFGSAQNERFQYHAPGSLEDYFEFLETLDIGLAPLLESPFNVCRSDVKFIEYASRGVLPLLSDAAPYRVHAKSGENAILFRDPEQMKSIIIELLEDRDMLQRIRQTAYHYATTRRTEELNSLHRLNAYRGLIGPITPGSVPLDRLRRTDPGSRLYEALPTSAEQKTREGLARKAKGKIREARDLWEDAAREPPRYALPCLLLAESLGKEETAGCEAWLREALKRNPQSLRARMLFGSLLYQRDHEGAKRVYQEVLKLSPDFSPAWRALAFFEKQEGREEESLRLLDRALRGNPFDAASAFDLGNVLTGLKRHKQAAEAFDVAANLIPDNPEYTLEFVKALISSGQPAGALEACRDFLTRNPENLLIQKVLGTLLERLESPDLSQRNFDVLIS